MTSHLRGSAGEPRSIGLGSQRGGRERRWLEMNERGELNAVEWRAGNRRAQREAKGEGRGEGGAGRWKDKQGGGV